MKRRNIFFALAFILAIGSAFTTKPVTGKPMVSGPGYALSSSCDPVVILCDDLPHFACTLPTGEQTYYDRFICTIPKIRSSAH